MLRSIIADFKSLDFEILTLIDYRISFLSHYLLADNIKIVNAEDNCLNKFKESVKESEFNFIIAPEFSNILYDLTKIVRDNNKTLLSVDLNGIKLGSSKYKTYEFFKTHGVNTPLTYQIPFKDKTLDFDFIFQKFNELRYPIVIKPDDGVGAENIYYLENETQISDLFNDYDNKFEQKRQYLLQEYIEGDDLSISLIRTSKGKNDIILSLNSQKLNVKNTKSGSEYFGGSTPIENCKQVEEEIKTILQKLDLSKFSGYFGIDFIRKNNGDIFFIEINPRLTTSYIGIRNVVNYNSVELLLKPSQKLIELTEMDVKIHSIFSRIELNYNGSNEIKENIIPKLINEIPELVTPPISFETSNQDKDNQFSCFIATKEQDLLSSSKKVREIIKSFEKFNFNVIYFK